MMCHRFITSYGLLCYEFLSDANSIHDLGELIGADLYTKEIEYLIKHEWARTTEDILWRRSKLGLKFSSKASRQLEQLL